MKKPFIWTLLNHDATAESEEHAIGTEKRIEQNVLGKYFDACWRKTTETRLRYNRNIQYVKPYQRPRDASGYRAEAK